jgi:hypothetical protein
MINLSLVILTMLITFQANHAFADSFSNRLIGRPLTKASSEATDSYHQSLQKADQAKYQLIITKSGNDYFWTSREGKILNHSKSGIFDLYVNPSGSGYIKTANTDGQCLYMEHLTMQFQTITYWGTCENQ